MTSIIWIKNDSHRAEFVSILDELVKEGLVRYSLEGTQFTVTYPGGLKCHVNDACRRVSRPAK